MVRSIWTHFCRLCRPKQGDNKAGILLHCVRMRIKQPQQGQGYEVDGQINSRYEASDWTSSPRMICQSSIYKILKTNLMLRDAVPKIRSLGPSFHNCDSRLQVECRDLVGHVGYEQQDSEEEGHLCLQPLKGRLTFTILPRPTLLTMHYFLIVARSHSLWCVVWRHFQWSPIMVPSPPYDPQKVALHLLVDSGMLPACWLMSDYLQGPGVSQRPARPTPHHQPHSWGSNWSARIWGQPSTSTPMPPRCKNYFSSLCFDIDHSPERPTNGPELFQPLTRALLEINHRPTFTIHETFPWTITENSVAPEKKS